MPIDNHSLPVAFDATGKAIERRSFCIGQPSVQQWQASGVWGITDEEDAAGSKLTRLVSSGAI